MIKRDALPGNSFGLKWTLAKDLVGFLPDLQRELDRAANAPGWNPKMVRLDGDRVAIDVCAQFGTGLLSSAWVIDYVDHPFLDAIPVNAPRAVKSIYKKEVRLKHARATDWLVVAEDWAKAYKAWGKFRAATK